MPDILPLSPSIETRWDELVIDSPDGWVYGLCAWRRLILAVSRWELEDFSFALEENGRLLGVIPLQYHPGSSAMASSGWGGCGPMAARDLAPRKREKTLRTLIDHAAELARQRGVRELSFWSPTVTRTNIDAPWGVNPFALLGMEDTSGLAQVIDLSADEDELWAGLSQSARQAVKKATDAGFTVDRGHWPDMVDAYFALHEQTYARTGEPPHPRKYFEGIAQELSPSGHSILWVCRNPSGQPAAFHGSTRLGRGGLYHIGCSHIEAMDCGANYLLFWQALLGMKRLGVRWYDCGEIFPGAHGKSRGLSLFKTRFGGEPHRFFKSRLLLADRTKAHAQPPGAEPSPPAATECPGRRQALRNWLSASRRAVGALAGQRIENALAGLAHAVLRPLRRRGGGAVSTPEPDPASPSAREIYENGTTYPVETICLDDFSKDAPEYSARLLARKMEIVARHWAHKPDGVLLDLCCGTGGHLFHLAGTAPPDALLVGLDFCLPYMLRAREHALESGLGNVHFLAGDATRLPLDESSVSTIFSLSALYQVPRLEDVIAECFRVLAPGGRCILDLGNATSLNGFCLRHYPELPSRAMSYADLRRMLRDSGLRIVEHSSFQLLPLWADRPRWLWPLLHPAWKRIMSRRLGDNMLDEHLSSLPIMRRFAFRHLVVCEKPTGGEK